jgi:hypothetical protein
MDMVKNRDDVKVVDFGALGSIEYLRLLFPDFEGTEFFVAPVDRSMDFTTDEVTSCNSLWLQRHHVEDKW